MLSIAASFALLQQLLARAPDCPSGPPLDARAPTPLPVPLPLPPGPRLPLWLMTHRSLRQLPRVAAVWSWLETLVARIG